MAANHLLLVQGHRMIVYKNHPPLTCYILKEKILEGMDNKMWKNMHYELGPPEDTLLPMDKVDVRISLLDILMK